MKIKDPYIKACSLFGFARQIELAGGNPDILFRKAGLDPNCLREPDSLLSYRLISDLFERASFELNQPSLIFDWIDSMAPHYPNLGPIVMLGHFSINVKEWAEACIKYGHVHTNAYTYSLNRIDDARGALRFHPSPYAKMSKPLIAGFVANIVAVTRTVLGQRNINPELVRFSHRKPSNAAAYEAFFCCPVEFDAEHTEFIFDTKYLDYPVNGNLSLFKPLLGIYVRYRLRHMGLQDQSIKNTVALALSTLLGYRRTSFESVADVMGINGKKLQRLLEKEGITFSEIIEEVRQSTAIHLLQDTDIPIERVAIRLDYSSNPAFTLAFKRWKGISPLQFRKEFIRSQSAEKLAKSA